MAWLYAEPLLRSAGMKHAIVCQLKVGTIPSQKAFRDMTFIAILEAFGL